MIFALKPSGVSAPCLTKASNIVDVRIDLINRKQIKS